MSIAIAAATLTEPPLVDADGVEVPPEPPAPFAAAWSSAKPRWLADWESTFGEPEPSEGPPHAHAVACVAVVHVPVEWMPSAPLVEVRSRSLPALTEWFATVRAIAAPTAVEPDAAPVAVVVTVPVCVAVSVMSPSTLSAGPAPRADEVLTFTIEMPTTGAAAVPPAAPPAAVVVTALVDVEEAENEEAPVSAAPAPIPADVVSSTTFSATDAPTPVAVPAVVFASAVAELALSECAANVSPESAATGAAPDTRAVVLATRTPTASAPATPVDEPSPAPEVAWVVNVDVPGASASTVTEDACSTALLARCASVVTAATVTPTAMPTAPEVVPSAGEPSASAVIAFFVPAWKSCAPVVCSVCVLSASPGST